MLDFARKVSLGLAAALAIGSAMPAAAATFGGDGWTGNPSCNVTGSSANTSADIDVLVGATFNSTFEHNELGGNLCFNLKNNTAASALVTLAVATVNQQTTKWGFLGGVSLASEQLGNLWTVAQGVYDSKEFSFLLGAGEFIYFDWTYGKAYASGSAKPQINFAVFAEPAPVPLPAGGLLLIGAIGGLAALRRRKSA